MSAAEKIAKALLRVREITKENRAAVIRSDQLLRSDRELLVRTKWLLEIIKGWYLLVKPDVPPGDSSVWYANLWDFLGVYLNYYYENHYCLSAENSLDLHTGCSIIPNQVVVIAPKGGGAAIEFPFNTSLLVYADPKNIPEERVSINGLQVMTVPYALCKVSATYFQKNPQDAAIALQLVRDSAELTRIILKYSFKNAAERLIGAYDFIGNTRMSEELMQVLIEMGWKIKGQNPFVTARPLLTSIRLPSPYAARILSLWKDYREKIITHFPTPRGLPKNPKSYFAKLEDLYESDAYNSLSIEGYQVNEDLIARVQNHEWNPDVHPSDLQERNVLAVRGYYEAFLEVKKSLARLFEGNNPGEVIERDLKKWYQHLFLPMSRVGIIREEDLFGYRRGQVYIRNSRHVPLPKEALIDAMEALFDCIKNEKNAAVRAVLGHYIFVFIHPYMDGNGRIGRFIMNAMFASGGYSWTIIRAKNRTQYLNALELAGPGRDIEPFAKFVAQEMKAMGEK